MGLMDRDYWKEKNRNISNRQSNNINPKVKVFMNSLQEQIDKHEQQVSYRKLVIFVILMTIGVLLISLNKVINDREELEIQKNQTQKIDIIPGIFSIVQTNFSTILETVDIEINISKSTKNFDRYLIGNEFFFEDKRMGGKIFYKIMSIDSNLNVNGKVTLMMWGGQQPILNSKSRHESPDCVGPLIRNSDKDDKIMCDGVLSSNLSILVTSKLNQPITLRVNNSKNNILKGYFSKNSHDFEEIGGFKYTNNSKLTNELTNYIEFIGKINSCSEMKPFEYSTRFIINNDLKGKSFIQDRDSKFECQNQVKTSIEGDHFVHKIIGI